MNSAYWGEPGMFRGWYKQRTRRGDISPIILRLLLEKPMHGYEIISRLEERSHGYWRPSAGAVYPNLQMLEEQDLVTSKVEAGKKTYSLTDKGKVAAEEAEEKHKAHWEERDKYIMSFKAIKPVFFETIASLKDIASLDSEEKVAKAKVILEDANKKLAKLTVKDEPASEPKA